MQLIDCFLEKWKFIIIKNYENAANLICHDHHSMRGSRVVTLDKLTLTKIYFILVQNKPSSNIYFEILFNNNDIGWAAICMLPRLVYTKYLHAIFSTQILNVFFIKNFIFLE